MNYKVINLSEYFPMLSKAEAFEPTLTIYCHDNTKEIDPNRRRPGILICPGGGYAFTSDREAEPVALSFLSRGYNTFVLHYSVAPERYPTALLQASAAIALIRQHAEEFNTDPECIAICGFSAGGHLAASLGTLWNEPFIEETLKIKKRINRPNAMILGYPVITSGEKAHRGTFENLLGKEASKKIVDSMSLENRVHADVPPTFLWHTFEDGAVPVENTLMFATSLKKHEIPFELHIFPEGQHGLSVCSYESGNTNPLINPHCANWVGLCDEWLRLTFNLSK
jgi:acetyl esterase/lipase